VLANSDPEGRRRQVLPDSRPERRRSRTLHVLGVCAVSAWPVVLVIVAWQAWIVLGSVPAVVAPQPSAVLSFVAENLSGYAHDAWSFLVVVLSGLVLGVLVGLLLAVVSWSLSLLRALLGPVTLVTQCLPIVVMIPILGRIFGYAPRTIVVIAAIIAFFPAFVFTSRGLSSAPPGANDLFVALGATRWRRFTKLAVPAAVPSVLLSVRLAVIGSVIGALVGQWILGTRGLGYRLALAQITYQTADAWGAALTTVMISITLFAVTSSLVAKASRRFE
jgi:ABC-type nitrate/sulfonate/bicarbonate transport system permease component